MFKPRPNGWCGGATGRTRPSLTSQTMPCCLTCSPSGHPARILGAAFWLRIRKACMGSRNLDDAQPAALEVKLVDLRRREELLEDAYLYAKKIDATSLGHSVGHARPFMDVAASPGCPGTRSCATTPLLHDSHPAARALERPTHTPWRSVPRHRTD